MDLLYIGSGPISNFHVPALKNAGFRISCIASRKNSKRCKEFAEKHNLKNCFVQDGWEVAVKKSKFDSVVLAIDTKFTPHILNSLIKYQIPIMVEKPVGWHPIQLKKILDENPHGSELVMVAYNRRFYKVSNLMKNFINSNNNGVLSISIPDSISSIRQFLVNGCHMIDLLNYLVPGFNIKYTNSVVNPKGEISSIAAIAEYKDNWQIIINSKPCSPDNFEIKASTDSNVYKLRPIEILEIYEGMEIVQPSQKVPLRRYLPKLSKSIIEDSSFKPGFEEQSKEFFNFCKYKKKSESFCSLRDAEVTLNICYELLGNNQLKYEDSILL